MPRTVVAVVEDRATAEALRSDLVAAGTAEAAIEIRGRNRAAAATHPVTTEPPPGDADESAMEHFFRSVFGFEEDVGRYTAAARGGKCVVVVYADDPPAADRARAVMERRVPHGAVQVHTR